MGMIENIEKKSINDILRLKHLTDGNFESNYQRIIQNCREFSSIDIDFSEVEWFDIWALIQLLFIIEDFHEDKGQQESDRNADRCEEGVSKAHSDPQDKKNSNDPQKGIGL